MGTWAAGTRGLLTLPNGRTVRGRAIRNGLPAGLEHPEFGLYLAARPYGPTQWASLWVRWPDFRLPHSCAEALAALNEAHERAATERVEIACRGGIGRTGTAIAILARLAGVPAAEVVHWTRAHYHPRAVETVRQRRFVESTDLVC